MVVDTLGSKLILAHNRALQPTASPLHDLSAAEFGRVDDIHPGGSGEILRLAHRDPRRKFQFDVAQRRQTLAGEFH